MADASTSYDNTAVQQERFYRCFQILNHILLCILFVAIALALAIVYTGKTRQTFAHPKMCPDILERQQSSQTVAIEDYPFIAALISVRPYLFLCSAVILNQRYLLTSANCFTVLFPNTMARIGSSFWDSAGELYEVGEFKLHELYDSRTLENNFAVVMLKRLITFDERSSAARIGDVTKGKSLIVGWGNE